MKFTPFKDEEITSAFWDEGTYLGIVDGAEEKTSQAGNQMMELHLKFFSEGKEPLKLRDRLVFTEASKWKISQFCKSIGKPELYKEKGEIAIGDIKGCKFMATVHKGKANEEGKRYLEVKAFLFDEESLKQVKELTQEFNDAIPF